MNDLYVTTAGMSKEQMFRLRLIEGFNFAQITADVSILLRVSGTMISNYVTDYEKRTNTVVPRAGTEMDLGKTLTHKRLAFHNYKKRYLPLKMLVL